jgi:hypothetical protein
MKKNQNQFQHKLFACLVLASFALTSFSPFFSNNVLALSPKFEPKLNKKATPSKEEIAESMSKMPIQFEENRGQFDKKVKFSSKQGSRTVFLTTTEAVFTQKISEKKNYALKMELVNANKDAKTFGSDEKVSKTNYFRGNDSSKWQTDVSIFGRVNYEEVYQGIDLTWYGNADNDLEYDFIVKPNADYQQIELKFKGAKSLQIAENGDLLIKTKYGTTTQRKPYTYQLVDGEKKEIESQYKLVGKKKVKFVVGEYDKNKDLVIDPTLLKNATFLGGSFYDNPRKGLLDPEGNLIVVGLTTSNDFPTTVGVFDTTPNGSNDIFAAKLTPNLSELIYSTYIGGSGGEFSNDFALDSAGNIYVVGQTTSADLPIAPNSFDPTYNEGNDGYIFKLSNSGTTLLYLSYFGGISTDSLDVIDVDSLGRAKIQGFGPFGTIGVGYHYMVVSSNGNSIEHVYSLPDRANDIAVDAGGNTWITTSAGSNYQVTQDAYDSTFNGGSRDALILKFNENNLLIYSTYFGGNDSEDATEIKFDSNNNIYILFRNVGSSNFPRVGGSNRPLSYGDSFLVKFDPTFSQLLLSTPIGFGYTIVSNIGFDQSNNLYFLGITSQNSFPEVQTGVVCASKVFLAKYSSDGALLKNFHCFGSNGYTSNFQLLQNGEILATMNTDTFTGYVVPPTAFDRTRLSGEAYVARLKFISQSIPYDFDADGKSDMAVYRNGTWHVNQSLWNYKAQPFGLPTDTPVPADYDGDGKTDFAVWRPSDVSGQPDFYVLKSSNNTLQGVSWGTTTDTPVPADYDGDGRVDFAVYRTSSGEGDFFVLNQTGTSRHYRFGVSGDKAVVNDYDGDGKADFAVFRPSTQTWYVANSTDNSVQYISWGLGTDKLVPADYDGDGKTDVAVFRESEGMWYINQSSNGQMKYQQWGLSTDKLVPADYDGDGKTDIAVYRDGQWFIWQSSNNSPNYANVFGNATDIPVQTLAVK